MKRISCISVILMLVAMVLVSCDGNINDLMGKMGGNVFGIEADTSHVDEAESKLDDAVSYTGDKADIDWEQAASFVGAMEAVSESPQLREAMAERLQEKVSDNAEQSAKVSEAMKGKLSDSKDSLAAALTAMNPESSAKTSLEAIGSAVDAIRGTIDEEPTKADLATVAIVGALVDKAVAVADIDARAESIRADGSLTQAQIDEQTKALDKQKEEIAVEAKNALDALKTIGIASVLGSSMEEVDLSVLVSSEKGLSRGEADEQRAAEAGEKISAAVRPILLRIKGLMEENGAYSEKAYAKVVRDMYSLRVAYEVFASSVSNLANRKTIDETIVSAISVIKGEMQYGSRQAWVRDQAGLTFDDIVYYALSVMLTERDGLYPKIAAYLDGASVKETLADEAKLDGVTEPEEKIFFNTATVLVDAAGWSGTVTGLAGEDLNASKILEIFHAH